MEKESHINRSRYLNFWRIALYLIVGSHGVLVLSMAAAIPYLIILQPWYISIPVVTWIINLAVLPVRCPLTSVENYVRVKLNLPRISGFIDYYWRLVFVR